MNRFKFNAFKQEFPALAEVMDLDDASYCEAIKIARVTRELLNYKPSWVSHDGSMVDINKKETFSFLLNDHTILHDAVMQESEHRSNYAHKSDYNLEGETVLEAIDRHGCSAVLSLIFLVRTGFVVRDHESTPDFSVVIYKPARNENLADLISEAASAAAAEVRAEANF